MPNLFLESINSSELLPLKIISTGMAVPERCVLSSELDHQLGLPAGYVEKRSGIAHRYHASNTASQAELAVAALSDALQRQQIAADSIDLLICASAIPIQALPCSAVHILKLSPLRQGIACFDINSTCVSFISALQVAAGLVVCNLITNLILTKRLIFSWLQVINNSELSGLFIT